MKKILLFSLFAILTFSASGQDDSLRITRDTIFIEDQDTVLIKSYAKRYNPRKALLYAAVLPGLGQVYNKKYWKVPLVYGGFYLFIKEINRINEIYKVHKVYLFENLERNLPPTQVHSQAVQLTTANLRRIVDRARRERDFMVILMGGLYILQIVDAHVDAHLKEFDLNPNLKASIEPTLTNDVLIGRQTGVSLILRF